MSSLTLRISLILSGALLLLTMTAVGVFRYQQQQDLGGGLRLPLPEQAAAIVELIETTPPNRLPVVLQALNSSMLHVGVTDQPPNAAAGEIRLPGVSWAVRGYLDKLEGRTVQAMAEAATNPSSGGNPENSAPTKFDRPLRLIISLRDGRFALIEARGGVWRYLLGLRLVSIAFLGLIMIGGASLWLLRQQIRPLGELVYAVERFGEDLNAPAMEERGAQEIRRLVLTFNRMQTRIRALIEGRTRLLAAISHDLGTYLTRLRLRAEFIGDPEQRDRAISDIEEMNALMSGTLVLGKIVQESETDENIDLAALVDRQIEGFAATGAKVKLVATTAAQVRGQATALNRVLSNLIANALKHAGSAEVTLRRGNAEAVELLVEDRGPGIPQNLRELVLEPFFREDAARNLNEAGFGLGLAIVAEVVRRHHGALSLADRPGGGLRVQVQFQSTLWS